MDKEKNVKKTIQRLGIGLAFGVSLLSHTAQAQSDFGFACNRGSVIDIQAEPIAENGWGNVQDLINQEQWSVWANNYNVFNPSQSTATATIALPGINTISQIGLYESQFSPATGNVELELIDAAGATIDANGSAPGSAVSINMAEGAQSEWHLSAALNLSGVAKIKLLRDAPTDNVAEIQLCSGQSSQPDLSVTGVQISEGSEANFIVSLSEPAPASGVSVDYLVTHVSTSANDFIGDTSGTVNISNGLSSTTISIQISDDTLIEDDETFQLLLSNAIGATLITSQVTGTIADNDSGGSCNYSAMSVPQACLPESAQAPDVLKSATFDLWREKIDGGVENYGVSNSGEACADLHDRYWVKGDDGKAYHTWHPTKANGCVFHHEHGTNPATSDILVYAGGYPPFGFAMEMQHQYASANSTGGHAMRHEDHVGHKVVVANNIRLAIGKSQQFDADIYDSGITCDWFSKIHQGSSSADAMTNHLHEYFLNVQCDDYDSNGVATAFSVKSLTQWGRMNELDSDTLARKIPYRSTGSPAEKCARAPGSPAGKDNYGAVCSELLLPWNGAPDYVAAPHLSTPDNGLGSRDFALFTGVQYKHWNSALAHGSKVTFPELWSGPAGKRLSTFGGSIKFAPYYAIKNPARMLIADVASSKYLLRRTVDLCYAGGVGSARVQGGFCSILPPTKPGADYWKSPQSAFNGSIRAINFKGIELRNANGAELSCTNPFGFDPGPLNDSGQCGSGKILQKASLKDNYWQSQGSGNNPCVLDTEQNCHNENLEGTIERWTLDFDSSNSQWVAQKGTAQHVGGAHYLGAGMGFEWIINGNDDDNDINTGSNVSHVQYGVRVPN